MKINFFKRSAAAEAPAIRPAEDQPEERATIGEMVRQSDTAGMLAIFGGMHMAGDEPVTVESALGVPVVFAAVNFLARALASMPFLVYEEGAEGRKEDPKDPVGLLMNVAANDETTGFDFRRGFWVDVFTQGRGLAFIERDGRGKVLNFWPLDVTQTTVSRKGGRTVYICRDGGRSLTYAAHEVLDVCFMPGADRLGARSPIYSNVNTIGLAQAVTKYGIRFFNNGGIPPYVITGPMKSGTGVQRAAEDVAAAVRSMTENRRNGIALPDGHEIKALGIDPEKMQMVDVKRFLIEEIARIYGLPPAMVGDLTHGTFSNVEHQDLQLVKHLLAHWAKAFEREVQLKCFGRKETKRRAKHNLDGLLRGDLKTRSEALSRQVAAGLMTPNEGRALENRPPLAGGDALVIQGAMAPLDGLGKDGEKTND